MGDGESGDFDRAWRMRVAEAASHGHSRTAAEAILKQLATLERHEYHKRSSGLDGAARRQLWILRAKLLGVARTVAETRFEAGGPLATVVTDYWQWVIEQAQPAVSAGSRRPRNVLSGNLAAAIGRDPARRSWVVDCWLQLAGGIGLAAAPTDEHLRNLAAVLAECGGSDAIAPTPRAVQLAVEVAALTGMPADLITTHSAEWLRQEAILRASGEALALARLGGAMADYQAVAVPGVVTRFLPRVANLPDGREFLILPSPVSATLDLDVYSKVIITLVEALRRGELPDPDLALRASRNVYYEWLHGKRTNDGDWIERRESASFDDWRPTDPPTKPEPLPLSEAARAAAADLLLARQWIGDQIDRRGQHFRDQLAEVGPAAIFPAQLYGARRTAALDRINLHAAWNCLLHLVALARLEPATLSAEIRADADPRAHFATHMRATSPDRWNTSDQGRQLVRGFSGAVTVAAWRLTQQLDPADAPEIGAGTTRQLVIELQRYTAIAALSGTASTLLRFARPSDSPRPGWLTAVEAGADLIDELLLALFLRPGQAGNSALQPVAAEIRELGAGYRTAATRSATPLAGRVVGAAERLITAAGLLEATIPPDQLADATVAGEAGPATEQGKS